MCRGAGAAWVVVRGRVPDAGVGPFARRRVVSPVVTRSYRRRMTTPVPGPGVVGVVSTPLANGAGPRRGALPRALVILIGAAAAVVVVAGIQATAWLIGPAFMALIVVIAVAPVQGWLTPPWMAGVGDHPGGGSAGLCDPAGSGVGDHHLDGPPGDRAAAVRVEGSRAWWTRRRPNWPSWVWDPSRSSRPRAR